MERQLRFLSALSFAPWTASSAFTTDQMFENGCSAYYLLLTLVMHAEKRRGSSWDQSFMAQVTTRNLLRMVAHIVLRLMNWPHGITLEPNQCMEDAIEMFFGRIKCYKRGVAGSATVANSIQACHLLHMLQSLSPKPVPASTRILEDNLRYGNIAEDSLNLACTFAAACQVGVSPAEVRQELTEWWEESGVQCLLVKTLETMDEDEDEDGEPITDGDDEARLGWRGAMKIIPRAVGCQPQWNKLVEIRDTN